MSDQQLSAWQQFGRFLSRRKTTNPEDGQVESEVALQDLSGRSQAANLSDRITEDIRNAK